MRKKKTSVKSEPNPNKNTGKNDVPKPTENQKEQFTAEEKPFDFGGIPDRNLKKNLGCG